MKPVAVIHYSDGEDKSRKVYTADELDRFTTILDFKKRCYYICMLSLDVSLPCNARKGTSERLVTISAPHTSPTITARI